MTEGSDGEDSDAEYVDVEISFTVKKDVAKPGDHNGEARARAASQAQSLVERNRASLGIVGGFAVGTSRAEVDHD